MSYEPLEPACPTQTKEGVAVHPEYGDVYHSLSGAMEQADYVFLQGNDLPMRWQGRAQFTICETGFGLGNNFLTTWYRWLQDPQRSQRLHFVSFEAHPLPRHELARQLQRSPAVLQPLAQQLIKAWPKLLPGLHRLEFEQGQLSLTLIFGRIEHTAPLAQLRADAFFLDGFAPRLNPAMWTPALFTQLVRLAAQGATLATWCTASAVRRALQNAGFVLEKRPGFAFKREMLTGRLRSHLGQPAVSTPAPKRVLVVGGGIVGAATAAALAHRGAVVTVCDPLFAAPKQSGTIPSALNLGAAHAGHAAVAMVPLLARQDPPRARLSRLGLALAALRWGPLLGQHWFLHPALHLPENASQAQYDRQTLEELGFDTQWVHWYQGENAAGTNKFPDVTGEFPDEAGGFSDGTSEFSDGMSLAKAGIAPYGGWYFHQSYVVRPAALIAALMQHPLITPIATTIQRLERQADGWRAWGTDQQFSAQAVVLANAAGVKQLLKPHCDPEDYPRLFRARVVQGQIGHYPSDYVTAPQVPLLNGPGYLLHDHQNTAVLGSSYQRDAAPISWSSAVQKEIEERLQPHLGPLMPQQGAQGGWVGERLASPDHRPQIGPVGSRDNALWVASAMGSNGFSWASVAAEYVAADFFHEPQVLTTDLQRAVALR